MKKILSLLLILTLLLFNTVYVFGEDTLQTSVSLPLQNTSDVHELVVTDITYNMSNDWVQITMKDNDNFMLASDTDWVTGSKVWHWRAVSSQLTDITTWVSGSNLIVRGYYTDKSKVPYVDISYCNSDNLSVSESYLSTGVISNGIQYYEIYDRAFIEFTEYVADGSGSSNSDDELIIPTDGCQQWFNYPESPNSINSLIDTENEYIYQCITKYNLYGDVWKTNLIYSNSPIYISGVSIVSDSLKGVSYSDGSYSTPWSLNSTNSNFTNILESNCDIFTDSSLSSVYFNKTTTDLMDNWSPEQAHYHDISESYQTPEENHFRFNGLVDSTECPNNLLVSFSSSVPTQFVYTYTSDYDSYKIYHYKIELASDVVGEKDVTIAMKYAGEEVYTETFTVNNTKEGTVIDNYLQLRNDYYFDTEFSDADIYYDTDTSYVMMVTNLLSGSFLDEVDHSNDLKVYARAIRKDGAELIIPVVENYCDGLVGVKDNMKTKLDMTFATLITGGSDDASTDPSVIENGIDDQIDQIYIRYDMVQEDKVVDAELVVIDYSTLLQYIMKYDEYNLNAPGFATGQWEFAMTSETGWHWEDGNWKYGSYETIDEYNWVDNTSTEGISSWLKDVYGVEDVAWTESSDGTITLNPSEYITAMINETKTEASDFAVENPVVSQAMSVLGDNWLIFGLLGVGLFVLGDKGQR